jgi:hypothetical protein
MLEDLQVAEEITDLTTLVDGLNKAAVSKPLVEQDPTNGDPYDEGGTFFTTIEVPDGALRLVAQVVESTSLDVDLFVGSGDTPSLATQLYSSATGAVLEYVSVDNPDAGTYWVLVQNWDASDNPPDLIALAVGAVVPGDAGNLTVTGPATVPPGGLFDLEVNWSNPELVDEDVYYGVFSVGTDPANPGNLGSVDVNFRYTQPIFITKTGPETAQTDEVIQYSIVLEGAGPIDGDAVLTDTLPVGVEFSGNLTATYGTATYDEATNSVYWTNVMPPSAAQPVARSQASRPVALVVDSVPAEGTIATLALPDDAVNLMLDDGTVETAIGLNSPSAAYQFLWFNRFTPAPAEFPFQLNQIDIFFTANSNAVVGDAIDLVVYQDLDGDPSNGAEWLKTYPVTIQVIPGLNSYDISADPVYFSGPGDVFIGAIDRWVVSGVTPPNFPAAQDATLSQQRSWVASWLADPPDPALLPSDDLYNLIDDFGLAGNWVIRGYGETVSFMPEVITITFDATVTAGPTEEVTNVADLVYDGDAFSAETTFRVPGVRLEVAHLAPFAADPGTAVTVTLNGAPALPNFEFADSTAYIPLPPGDYDVAVIPAGATDPAISGTVSLMDGMDYSAIATGDGANQDLGLLALVDDNTPPAAATFHLRIGHLAPFASGDALADVRHQNGDIILDDVAFGDVTGFLPLPAGEYDLKITSPDGMTTYIDPLPVTFTEGQIVSAYAVGDGVNQPLGVFAWPAGVEGFLLPLAEPEPVARLAVAHLAPFAADPGTAVTVTLNGAPVLPDFEFAESTVYLEVPAGVTHTVEIFPAGSATPAISAEINLMEGMDYSAIANGGANAWPLGLLAQADDNSAPAAGNFKLRIGHLAPFADTEDGTLADVRLQDGTIILDDVPFGAVADYLELPAGTYDLKITSPDGMTTYIDPLPVPFAAGDIVSAYAVGDGVNQPLGVFAWPADAVGFLLPLAEPEEEEYVIFLPVTFVEFTP